MEFFWKASCICNPLSKIKIFIKKSEILYGFKLLKLRVLLGRYGD